MPLGLVGFDKRALNGAPSLVGIDEAGRGCLAGPVVVAAGVCQGAFYQTAWCRRRSRLVDDSKRLSPDQRATVVEVFKEACQKRWIRIGIGLASIEEIERHNIYHATTLAMRRALEEVLDGLPEWKDASALMPVLVDGRPIRTFPVEHQGVVKGDQRSLAIALAGIHAKEWRDAHMRTLDAAHPEYGFGMHKGYGTKQHVEALHTHGPAHCHRPSFLKKIFPARSPLSPAKQGSLFLKNRFY